MVYLDSLKIRAGAGMPVTVTGGIFDVGTIVKIGGLVRHPTEIEKNSVTFTAPAEVDAYDASIEVGSESQDFELVVVPVEEAGVYELSDRGVSEFEEMQVGMMPRGFALDLAKGSYLRSVIDAIALCLLYVYNVLKALVSESSPVKSTSLGMWENELGLPRKGLVKTSYEDRRKEIVRISRGTAGLSLNYLRSILDIYGQDGEVVEYWKNDAQFPGWVKNLDARERVFYVMIKVYKNTESQEFTCNSTCNDSLGSDRDTILEALLEAEKSAHIRFIYSYYCRVLTDETDTVIMDDSEDKYIIGV